MLTYGRAPRRPKEENAVVGVDDHLLPRLLRLDTMQHQEGTHRRATLRRGAGRMPGGSASPRTPWSSRHPPNSRVRGRPRRAACPRNRTAGSPRAGRRSGWRGHHPDGCAPRSTGFRPPRRTADGRVPRRSPPHAGAGGRRSAAGWRPLVALCSRASWRDRYRSRSPRAEPGRGRPPGSLHRRRSPPTAGRPTARSSRAVGTIPGKRPHMPECAKREEGSHRWCGVSSPAVCTGYMSGHGQK